MLALNKRYIHKAMPDYSGIAFFDLESFESSFFQHPQLALLIVNQQVVDWSESDEASKREPDLEVLLNELIKNGYLERSVA